tara:strand:- start:6155 stop:6403 length:249 start_codon:yes stop_codon:yes gene_type:complete
MKTNEDLKKEIEKLKNQIEKTKKQKTKLNQANDKLQDEVDSLWAMMDEMAKSDVKNWTHILNKLEKDTAIDVLMATKNKAEA